MLNALNLNDNKYTYKFFVNHAGGKRVGGGLKTFTGRVVEQGDDWLRIRTRIEGDDHDNVYIPLHSILYIEEKFSRE